MGYPWRVHPARLSLPRSQFSSTQFSAKCTSFMIKQRFKGNRCSSDKFTLYHSIPVVNLNLNRTCTVCTGLPDNSVYWPDPMVQYVALTRLTYDRGQFSWHSPVRGANEDNSRGAFRLFTVPGLILGLFDRPHWLSPPWYSPFKRTFLAPV